MWCFGTDQILVGNDTVMNYVEVVLKNTDNGVAVKKGYIVYLTTHLLPVNNNLSLHLFWSKLQYCYIMISE